MVVSKPQNRTAGSLIEPTPTAGSSVYTVNIWWINSKGSYTQGPSRMCYAVLVSETSSTRAHMKPKAWTKFNFRGNNCPVWPTIDQGGWMVINGDEWLRGHGYSIGKLVFWWRLSGHERRGFTFWVGTFYPLLVDKIRLICMLFIPQKLRLRYL